MGHVHEGGEIRMLEQKVGRTNRLVYHSKFALHIARKGPYLEPPTKRQGDGRKEGRTHPYCPHISQASFKDDTSQNITRS